MIGRKEWFAKRYIDFWMNPITWQGWVYVAVGMGGFFFFAYQEFLPIKSETSYKISLIWCAIFLLDMIHIRVSLKER